MKAKGKRTAGKTGEENTGKGEFRRAGSGVARTHLVYENASGGGSEAKSIRTKTAEPGCFSGDRVRPDSRVNTSGTASMTTPT